MTTATHDGISIGDAAMQLLARDHVGRDINIDDATARLDHIKATTAQWREAVAYLALQAGTYRSMSNLDAELAMGNVALIVEEFRARRKRLDPVTPTEKGENRG